MNADKIVKVRLTELENMELELLEILYRQSKSSIVRGALDVLLNEDFLVYEGKFFINEFVGKVVFNGVNVLKAYCEDNPVLIWIENDCIHYKLYIEKENLFKEDFRISTISYKVEKAIISRIDDCGFLTYLDKEKLNNGINVALERGDFDDDMKNKLIRIRDNNELIDKDSYYNFFKKVSMDTFVGEIEDVLCKKGYNLYSEKLYEDTEE